MSNWVKNYTLGSTINALEKVRKTPTFPTNYYTIAHKNCQQIYGYQTILYAPPHKTSKFLTEGEGLTNSQYLSNYAIVLGEEL